MVPMPERTRFSPILRGAAFRTGDVAHHGLTPDGLRSPQLATPFRGVRALDVDVGSVHGRCLAYEPLLAPNQLFCSVTAARLLGLPLPHTVTSDPRVHIGSVGGQGPRRVGVVGHRLPSDTVRADAPGGFTTTDAATTWCQLACVLGREDLVAVGDCIVSGQRLPGGRRTPPMATLDELRGAVERHASGRGAAALRWALDRVRVGVDSAPESLLRLLLVRSGFAEPEIALPVLVEGGTLTLHPDLAWPELRLALEYEGDGHRENRKTFRADIRRREMFEAVGWRVIRVTADDLGPDRATFILRVREIVAARRSELAVRQNESAVLGQRG